MKQNASYNVTLLTGPPGSGKSTIGKFLENRGGYIHVSTGDLFRALTDEEQKEQAYYMDRGEFLPDSYIYNLLQRNLDDMTADQPNLFEDNKLLLDGFPRTHVQADMLNKAFNVNHVLLLTCSDDISKKRCLERGKKSKRIEDLDPKLINNRLSDYHTKTAPVFDLFSKNIITEIHTGTEIYVEKFKPLIPSLLNGTAFGV